MNSNKKLLKDAIAQAYEDELNNILSNEELNKLYIPSSEMENRINRIIRNDSQESTTNKIEKVIMKTVAAKEIISK